MKTFEELVELSKNFNLNFTLEQINNNGDDNLKLSNHFHPWSLKKSEAKIVYDIICENNLKLGFEIATAFGVSSSVMGQALLKTNGKLITMDAYVEEEFNHSGQYNINTKFVKTQETADGYKMASNLLKSLGLSETVFLEIGWSPNDVPSILNKHLNGSKLDFAFIDGGHSIEQIHADVLAIKDYLNDNCILFFHDYTDVSTHTIDFVKKIGFNNSKDYKTGFHLCAYSRGDIFNL
jgi:predicted O-methyltransferase YrrM